MARVNSTALTRDERAQVSRALAILKRKLERKAVELRSSHAVRDYLRLKLAPERVEVFFAVWLDGNLRAIAFERLFRGTLTSAAIYPREVVRAAIKQNAAAVIFAHNHPSGNVEPSPDDVELTQTLKAALALIDVRVLDHFVVGGADALSMAELGKC